MQPVLPSTHASFNLLSSLLHFRPLQSDIFPPFKALLRQWLLSLLHMNFPAYFTHLQSAPYLHHHHCLHPFNGLLRQWFPLSLVSSCKRSNLQCTVLSPFFILLMSLPLPSRTSCSIQLSQLTLNGLLLSSLFTLVSCSIPTTSSISYSLYSHLNFLPRQLFLSLLQCLANLFTSTRLSPACLQPPPFTCLQNPPSSLFYLSASFSCSPHYRLF